MSEMNISTEIKAAPTLPKTLASLQRINKDNSELLAPVIGYVLFLMLLGVVGNPMAIFIYGWKWRNTTSRVFLFFLAWMDLINCLVTMPTEIYAMVNLFYFPNSEFCRLSRFVTYFINNTTSATFLAIAIDRYIRICHPHNKAISIRGAKLACLLATFVGAAVSWPALVFYGRKTVHLSANVTGVMCEVRNEWIETPYPDMFFTYLCVAVCVCSLVLAGLYIPIGRVMLRRRRASKRRKKKRIEMENLASVKLLEIQKNNNSEQRDGQPEDGVENGTCTNSGEANGKISVGQTAGHDETQQKHACPTQVDLVVKATAADSGTTQLVTTTATTTSSLKQTATDVVGDAVVEESEIPSGDTNKCLRVIHSAGNSIKRGRIRPAKSTVMLAAITAVFVLSFLPFLVVIIIRQARGKQFYPSLNPTELVLVHFFLRSYLINNCTNPIVYGMCNSQFRYQVRRLLRMRVTRRDSSISRGESRPPPAGEEVKWTKGASSVFSEREVRVSSGLGEFEVSCGCSHTVTSTVFNVDGASASDGGSEGSVCALPFYVENSRKSNPAGYHEDDGDASHRIGLQESSENFCSNSATDKESNLTVGNKSLKYKQDEEPFILHEMPYLGPTSDL